MKTFKINDQIQIECEWKKTKMAFKHVATLWIDGRKVDETKICYQNRTWERYEFESVLGKLIDKTKFLSEDRRAEVLTFIGNYKEGNPFGGLLMIAKIGDVLCDTKEEKNNWKQRMMKASLGEAIDFPEGWPGLSEDEREVCLNGGLEILRG
ncbi:MAG: hypothetical protein IMZ43_12245 [Thermoplasmata archaeon]|nr:hypothetical protein [Thermoplasmata archaeon]